MFLKRFLPSALPLFICSCCLLLAGCGDSYLYDKTIEVQGGAWTYQDTLVFRFDIPDTAQHYTMLLDVTHAGDYGFQNLYVQFHTTHPSGKTDARPISLELADPSGVWYGKCSGNDCTVEIALQEKAIFREAGTYTLAVEQFMRQSPLPGVKKMRLRIGRLESRKK